MSNKRLKSSQILKMHRPIFAGPVTFRFRVFASRLNIKINGIRALKIHTQVCTVKVKYKKISKQKIFEIFEQNKIHLIRDLTPQKHNQHTSIMSMIPSCTANLLNGHAQCTIGTS